MKSFLIFLLLLVFASLLIGIGLNESYKEMFQIKSKLGKKILFDKDSVIIVDYHSFQETYVLSNGKEINFKLVK